MTNFNLDALEKALSKKGRAPRQDLSPLEGKSEQELYGEALRLANDLYSIYDKSLQTRYKEDSYYIRFGTLRKNGNREDMKQVPKIVLKRFVANGRRHLKDYYDSINHVIMQNPEIALEANLEGKTNTEVLRYIYDKREDQIVELLNQRVISTETDIYFSFHVAMKPPLGEEFKIIIDWWSHRSRVQVNGVSHNVKNAKDMAKLVHFLTYFEQVTSELNRQLDAIEIRKEVKDGDTDK